jgi:ankyrin repeat protein
LEEWRRLTLLSLNNRNSVVLAALLNEGLPIDVALDDEENTPLHHAALNGDAVAAAMLIDRGGGVEIENVGGLRPMHCAAIAGAVPVLRALKAKGGDASARDLDGRTPLHFAAEEGGGGG